MAQSKNLYPSLRVDHIKNPNRFYAFFILGIVVKFFMLIPVFIELIFLGIAYIVVILINSLVVLFTGKYWKPAYTLTIGIMRLSTKMQLFLFGLTNKYPGFDLENTDSSIAVDMPMPDKPNRLFAFPILGGLVRLILLIPFAIYNNVIQTAAGFGVFGSFAPVLFMGKYPESTYELARDHTRLQLAMSVYMSGLSDSYPNFWISMNHKTVKIFLIVLAVLYMLLNQVAPLFMPQSSYYSDTEYNYGDTVPDNSMMEYDSSGTTDYNYAP